MVAMMKYELIRDELIKKHKELEQRLKNTQKHINHEDGPPDPEICGAHNWKPVRPLF